MAVVGTRSSLGEADALPAIALFLLCQATNLRNSRGLQVTGRRYRRATYEYSGHMGAWMWLVEVECS